MKTGAIATFMTIDVLLVLTPGPDWAYVVAVGLRDRMVLPAVAGLVAGYAALTALIAAGLAVLITTRPGALTAVTLIVAVLPQFVDRHGGLPVSVQLGLLGAIHMVNCGVVYLSVGTVACNVLAARPTAAHALTRVAGAAMIALGGLLLLERALT
jgi:threonine/homoserine/homoserine lactone efflux protein